MHMGNELLNPAVGAATMVVSGCGLAWAARKTAAELNEKIVPMMGVMGAFIFAAQMINFPVLVGASGHLGGGTLLAILLGPHAAAIVMASVLVVQCLIFQDGGLLALGANILNIGLIPAYLGYGVYRGLRRVCTFHQGPVVAAFVAALGSVVVGAALIPLEVALAGVYRVPLELFLGLMVGVHLLIGIVEGVITVSVIAYVHQMRPTLVDWHTSRAPRLSFRGLVFTLLAAAALMAGGVSWYASARPDGLEWVTRERLQPARTETSAAPADLPALLPGYDLRDDTMREQHPRLSKGVSGAIGAIVVLVVITAVGALVRRKKTGPA